MFVNIWIESPDSDNQLLVVNKDCMKQNLMDYIIKECQLKDRLEKEDAILDLADEDGILKHVPRYHPMHNASSLLTSKATYIPVLITRKEDGSLKAFEPVPQSLVLNQEFMTQLNAQFERRTKPAAPPPVTGKKGQTPAQGGRKAKERMGTLEERDDSAGGGSTGQGPKGNTPKKKGKR